MQSHDRLQQLLQLVAQNLHWTYAIFWHLCPQRGVLVWRDGYYNGTIKTRKTVQPTEVSMEDVALHRSRQLRELYDALSAGEANAPARRSCAALSPEDLTESEWFFLMCISFSFPPDDDGLPGKAYARRKHVWLTRANEADGRVFSRAILAKSAGIQTVACIPLADGVLELGSLDEVEEDVGVVRQARRYFSEQDEHCLPALSDHSTSTPANADHLLLVHAQQLPIVTPTSAANISEEGEGDDNDNDNEEEEEEDDDDDDDDGDADDDDEEEEEEEGVYYEDEDRVEVERTGARANGDEEPSELMQLEMSEGIRLGSPDDCSENLNSELRMLAMGQHETIISEHGTYQAWQHLLNDDLCNSPAQPSGSPQQMQDLSPEDAHYSDTVSAILNNNPSRWTDFSYVSSITQSMNSAFTAWTRSSEIPHGFHGFSAQRTTPPPQWVLKFILFSVPRLHYKHNRGEGDHCITRFSRRSIPQEELTANHVLAERRRREKLNERFVVLRSLVPFVTKMDKASILDDTIEYVKRLRRQIQELESRNRQFEISSEEQNRQMIQANKSCSSQTNALRNKALLPDKRKLRMLERGNKSTKFAAGSCANVQVSVIETEALLELQCPYRDGLLLKIIQTLHELKVETTSIQSSTTNGVLLAEIRAKVKGECRKKASIMEVKKAIDHIIQQY